jgi:hypothetical protein
MVYVLWVVMGTARMKYTHYYTANSWDFGFGINFYSEGKAIPGYWTIRPFSIALMFGPHTWEWERPGRCEVFSN